MEFNWWQGVGLFFAAAVLDATYAVYTVAVIKSRAVLASSMSFLTYLLMAVGILSFVDNGWYVLPLALGAFVGTYVVLKWETIKKRLGKM